MIPTNQFWFNSGGLNYIYLLDEFPNARAAYSLRKLKSDYAGNCIELRRSSDNSLLDIGFDGNEIDVAAALAFIGAGDGFVRTWYDQSGNGLNLAKGANNAHPQIISSGTFITNSGKYALYYPDANRNLNGAAVADWKFLHDGTSHSIYILCQVGLVASPETFVPIIGTNNGTSAANGMWLYFDDNDATENQLNHLIGNNSGSPATSVLSNVTPNNAITANVTHLITVLADPTNGTASERSSMDVDAGIPIMLNAATGAINNVNPPFTLQLGGYGNSPGFTGYFSELIIYPVEQNSADNSEIQANMLEYYGLSAAP